MSNGCKEEKSSRETISGIVLKYATTLAEKSEKILNMASNKLTPVMLTLMPCTKTSDPLKEPKEYPPFFEEIRTKLQTIEKSLDCIEDMISRTEF